VPVSPPSPAAGALGDDEGRVEAVPHVVQRGENFWTISRLYYGYGRYYKALWAANRRAVPAIDKLYVGQTIRIPPPEDLDPSLIEPSRERAPAGATASPTSGSAAAPAPSSTAPFRRASSRPGGGVGSARPAGEVEVALPTSDPFAPGGTGTDRTGEEGSAPRTALRPRRLVHKVLPHETLRSIARDALGNSRRADEIYELNADAIDDPHHLVAGQILMLPNDAKVGAEARRGR
jgi:nucleoid-associated protein YgaU